MFVPTEITRDSDTKVGMGTYHIQQDITKSVIATYEVESFGSLG